MNPTKYYRYDAVEYAVHDADGELVAPTIPDPKVQLSTYIAFKTTKKGVWLKLEGLSESSWKRWVGNDTKKRYAYPTKEEALKGFILRTRRRIQILTYQLQSSKIALGVAEQMVMQATGIHTIPTPNIS